MTDDARKTQMRNAIGGVVPEFKGKGSFSISRENLVVQLDKERAKPPSPERDEMIAHMEGMLAAMGES